MRSVSWGYGLQIITLWKGWDYMMIECPKCSSDDITTLDYVTVYAEIDVNEGELIEVLSNDKPESKEYFCKSCSNEWEGE